MCPDIRLYDFRVLAKTLDDTEFAIIAALQYIRYVNERHRYMTIHGANLSLSIPHNVRNYACGRRRSATSASGWWTAASWWSPPRAIAATRTSRPTKDDRRLRRVQHHRSRQRRRGDHGGRDARLGAAHLRRELLLQPRPDRRRPPQAGPGAPGERIRRTDLDNDWGWELDGTSMAAPHVSGAAAMLMARYSELIGQPRRIKRILCETATDLAASAVSRATACSTCCAPFKH